MKMSDSQRIMVVALCMLSLLLAVGCAQKGPLSGDYIDMTDCDVPTVLAVEVPHGLDETLAYGATDIRLADSILLIARQYSDHFIHLTDLRSGETVAKVQHVGRGPGEAVNTFYIGVSEDGEYFWAHDMQLSRINIYRLKDVLSGRGLPVRSLTCKDPSAPRHEMDFVFAGDSIYTCPLGLTEEVSRFSVYDSTYNNRRNAGEWPPLEGTYNLPGTAYSSVFNGSLAYLPEADRLAVAHDYLPLVTIYGMDGSIVSNVWGPEDFMPGFRIVDNSSQMGDFAFYGSPVAWDEDARFMYSALRSHGGRLYALFSWERMSPDDSEQEDSGREHEVRGNNGEGTGDEYSMAQEVEDSRIVVLDSDGQPLQIIHVDGQLYMFDIDPETKDIWGFDGDYVLHHYKY